MCSVHELPLFRGKLFFPIALLGTGFHKFMENCTAINAFPRGKAFTPTGGKGILEENVPLPFLLSWEKLLHRCALKGACDERNLR